MNHDEQREKDLLNLCSQVINMAAISSYNPNGADDSTCPICHEREYGMYIEMSDIAHSPNCGYLIAKDLLTNIL